MPEITPSTRPTEAYSPLASTGAGELVRDGRSTAAVRTTSQVDEASRLLSDGQLLLQESRTAEAEPLLLRALELYEREEDVPAECVHVLNDLASIAITRGDLSAGESLLQRALVLANTRLGGDHPHVATMLGALARLYMRRSEFAKAEPLLQRLLEIKRARGDDHPEVATVLASLATVHSAMGAHASAERILRRVLMIREKALAPNHFATMTTLEHLAESCAARGKFDEALMLLHRALTMRERTLGGSHPSIDAARTRIADLELLSSNEDLGSVPIVAPMMDSLPSFSPRVSEPVAAVDEPVASADEPVDAEPPPRQVVAEAVVPLPREVRAALEDEWNDELERMRPRHWLLDQLSAKAGVVTAFARTPRGRLTVLAIGVASLLGALIIAIRPRAGVTVSRADASVLSRPAASSNSAGVRQATVSSAPRTLSPDAASVDLTRRPTTSTSSARRAVRSEGSDADVGEGSEPALPSRPRVRAFDVPVDRPPVAPSRALVVTPTDFATPSASRSDRSTPRNQTDQSSAVTVHAVLQADNPAPEYPPDLLGRRIDGRVVAEFLVDERGRVDTRTLRIISSTHERFSEAVRDVLPSLRFIPAESDGVRTEERVEMPFRFSPKPE